MATNKTLTPTNVVIQIPDFTDRPDQRVTNNCIDKMADAVNALNSKIENNLQTIVMTSLGNRTFRVNNPSDNNRPFGILICSFSDVFLVSAVNGTGDLGVQRLTTGSQQSSVFVNGRNMKLGNDANRIYTIIAPYGFTFTEVTT